MFQCRAKGWIMYGMDSELSLGDQLKTSEQSNLTSLFLVLLLWGFLHLETGFNHYMINSYIDRFLD